MKRSGTLFVLVLVTMTMGNAQQNYGVEVSVSSGFVLPASPMTFANYWNMQYGGGMRAGIPLSESITLIGSFEYYRFKLSEKGVRDGFDANYMRQLWVFDHVSLNPSADPSSVTTVSANLRVAPSGLSGFLSPYFIGGVGVMRFSLGEIRLRPTSVLSVNGSNISMTAEQIVLGGGQTSACFQLGLGFDLRATESFDVFVEGRYVSRMGKGRGAAYLPLTVGAKVRL